MTKRQDQMSIGLRFCNVGDLVCSRRNPPLEAKKTRLRRAALGLLTFFSYCRDNMIDPCIALIQAETIQREQPLRTSEDYMREAKDNGAKTEAGDAFSSGDSVQQRSGFNDDD